MVRLTLAIALSLSTVCFAGDKPKSANDLMKYMSSKAQKERTAAQRLESSQWDADSLTILEDVPILYHLSNGTTVLGIIMNNGTQAPALKTSQGLIPACVARDFTLVPGYWNAKMERIECNLKASELALIDNQVGADWEAPTVRSSRYSKPSEKGPGNPEPLNGDIGDDADAAIAAIEKLVKEGAKTVGIEAKAKPRARPKPANPNIYVPPTNRATKNTMVSSVLKVDRGYGIVKGTWAKGKIERQVTNTESGDMEIILTEGIVGRYQTLPAGTILFASKGFNASNRRLEAVTNSAVTPNGGEIDGINAHVYSLNKTAGLSGTIVRNIDGELKAAGSNIAIDVAKRLLPTTGKIAADAVVDLSQEMLDNQKSANPLKPQTVIRVAPQIVLIKIARSF